jgi:hypothetical protein
MLFEGFEADVAGGGGDERAHQMPSARDRALVPERLFRRSFGGVPHDAERS